MTKLKHPVIRLSRGLVREKGKYRPVIIILRPPNVLAFRAKGCRQEYELTAEACYALAVRAKVLEEKRQKTKERK